MEDLEVQDAVEKKNKKKIIFNKNNILRNPNATNLRIITHKTLLVMCISNEFTHLADWVVSLVCSERGRWTN